MTTCSTNSAFVDVSTSSVYLTPCCHNHFLCFLSCFKSIKLKEVPDWLFSRGETCGRQVIAFLPFWLPRHIHTSHDLSAVVQRGQAGPVRPHSTAERSPGIHQARVAVRGPWAFWHAGTVGAPLSCPPLCPCSPWIAGVLPKMLMFLLSDTQPLTSRTQPSAISGEKAGCIISRSSPRRGR